MRDVYAEYQNRKQTYQKKLQEKSQLVNRIGNFRLLTALLGIFSFTLSIIYLNGSSAVFLLSAFFILFLFLVRKHQKITEECNYLSSLVKINQKSVDRINGDWKDFKDTGEDLLDENHMFAQDLDIFGKASLFQWINTTTTYMGRQKLKEFLLYPCQNIEEIKKRQKTIIELSSQIDWRQQLQVEGTVSLVNNRNYLPSKELFKWATKEINSIYTKPWLVYLIRILPLITIIVILLYFFGGLPFYYPFIGISLQILLIAIGYKDRTEDFSLTQNHAPTLKAYKNMVQLIETANFSSEQLLELQEKLVKEEDTALEQLNRLDKIVDAIFHRTSQMYLLFNILFLADYHLKIALESWKKESGNKLPNWFDCIGYVEALSSLSVLSFNNPDWNLPSFTNEKSVLEAKNLGHPLLTEDRVCNDLIIKPPTSILLITGSNMSGKSTLLRTVGINLILAYIGSAVCADYLNCSIMKVQTCMRVNDDLDKNLSSFYAELLRIRDIVKEAKQDIQVFFLLDEIFKGTNSQDRHIGAKAVINNLRQDGAVGLVSTHDLELGALEKEQAGIKNYHFREFYRDNEIIFDYKLRPGLSPTTNAQFLMNMVGIDTNDD
ncbi:MutS family DNA mismatch repair protein [Natranaerobius trueperi]|uniref:DNA mismatch repair protein n=1 Tax=Natranaerobius trueperi TaxID=759412 RepID=A0A226C1A3_9FIRM|nr:MutS family DNA mismatch repair protein [Natranaerobius trueperi]OWZ84394.1 DNA mismatch repair protein [Natranaerobius trueperi]